MIETMSKCVIELLMDIGKETLCKKQAFWHHSCHLEATNDDQNIFNEPGNIMKMQYLPDHVVSKDVQRKEESPR
jgi:hypothetical protein